MPGFDDDLWLGPVTGRHTQNAAGSAPPSRGFGPLGRTYVYDIVPAALSATAICAAQAIAGAGAATINGANASGGVATNDYSRCLRYVSSNVGDTTQTVTVVGTDIWGNPQTETKTLNGTTVVSGTKAFKTVTSVTVSAALAGNLSVGTIDKFGLPVYLKNGGYLLSAMWQADATATFAKDAGTLVLGDATSPATATTTDTRGCYTPSSAADGSKRLVLAIALTGVQVGPSGTLLGLMGVTPA